MATVSKKIHAILSDCCGQKEKLRNLALEIVTELSTMDPSGDEGVLDTFVSELVLSAADQRRKRERRQHQMECIAAAKARGVRFGAAKKPLPENFLQYYKAWQDGEMTVTQAANACGISRRAFYRAIDRVKESEDYSA